MDKLNNNIDNIFKNITDKYGNSSDIVKRIINIGNSTIAYVYLESVSSDEKISNFFMKNISNYLNKKIIFDDLFNSLKNSIPNSNLDVINNYNDLFYRLSSGFTCIFVEGNDTSILIETKVSLDRGVSESSSEVVIRGPKDSFTESHSKNLGLIRKRIKDNNLWFNDIIVGRRTKSKITIGYINDIADLDKVEILKKKLKRLDVDGILDSGYIREFLKIDNSSSFPQIISTERPDLTCGSLLEGKIVILVENSPYVLLLPGIFIDFLHTSEDYYQKPMNVSLTRILRLISFLITIITPAFYIALTTWNHEVIPNELLLSLAKQREGMPLPSAIEVLLMVTVFEILREADLRTPSTAGTAIGIVGALVLGEAAVSAGIVSPIIIIVVAITSISGFLYNDMDFINGIRWWRLIFILFSMILGLFGFIIAGLIFIIHLCSIESLNVPYLSPISPLYIESLKDSFIRLNRFKQKTRAPYLSKKNKFKIGDNK